MSPIDYCLYSTKLFFTLLVRKNLYLNFFITSFSQYTTICFVSFVYSVFNEQFRVLLYAGRPKWTRTTFKYLSLTSFEKSRFRFLKGSFFYLVLLVGPSGLEPPTSCLSGTRSNLLSYEPMWLFRTQVRIIQRLEVGLTSYLFLCVSTELSSRTVARKVFSPLQSLTSVFGMGTGGPSAFIALTFSKLSLTEN